MNSTDAIYLIDGFWQWFSQNELTYRKIFDDNETDLIDDILSKLIRIQRGLAVEFEKHDEIYVMTVSADGIEEYFDIVQEIVNKAPLLNNWKFFAFRRPYGKEQLQTLRLTVYDHELDPKQIMFLPLIEDGMLYIQIFSKDINDGSKGKIGYGCLMLLDNIIGEYACVKEIDGFEYYNLSEADEFKNQLKPLIEIRESLNAYYQRV